MRRILILALLGITVACGSRPAPQLAQRGQTPRETQTAADAQTPRDAQTARAAQPASDGQTVPQTDNDQLTVYITDTGERYHLFTCRTLRSRHPISLAEAKRRGYTPCKICQPPR